MQSDGIWRNNRVVNNLIISSCLKIMKSGHSDGTKRPKNPYYNILARNNINSQEYWILRFAQNDRCKLNVE